MNNTFTPPSGPREHLAFINPGEARTLRGLGAIGRPAPGSNGIPSYWTDRGDNAGPSGGGWGPGSGPSRGLMGAGYNPNAGHSWNMTPQQQFVASGGSTQYEHPGASMGLQGVTSGGGGGVTSGGPSQGPSIATPNPFNLPMFKPPTIKPVVGPPEYVPFPNAPGSSYFGDIGSDYWSPVGLGPEAPWKDQSRVPSSGGPVQHINPSTGDWGHYANGGRPPVGRPSMVGERGPEMFVPDRAGTVVPNGSVNPMLIRALMGR